MAHSLISAVFIFLVAPLIAQTVVKGHHLGETASEFLAADHEIQDRLNTCHKDASHVLTVAQIHALPDEDIASISLNYPDYPHRKKLEQRAAAGVVSSIDKRYPGQKVFCDAAINVLENGKDGLFLSDVFFVQPLLSTRQFLFWKGHLAQIELKLTQVAYEDVLKDFSNRTSSKPSERAVPMQNAMGAEWKDRIAVWTTTELYATLHDYRNPAEPELLLNVQTAEAHQARLAAEEASHKSSLDK